MPGALCLPAWRHVHLDATRFRLYQTLTYVGTEAGGRWDFHFSRAQCEFFSTFLHTHAVRLYIQTSRQIQPEITLAAGSKVLPGHLLLHLSTVHANVCRRMSVLACAHMCTCVCTRMPRVLACLCTHVYEGYMCPAQRPAGGQDLSLPDS